MVKFYVTMKEKIIVTLRNYIPNCSNRMKIIHMGYKSKLSILFFSSSGLVDKRFFLSLTNRWFFVFVFFA